MRNSFVAKCDTKFVIQLKEDKNSAVIPFAMIITEDDDNNRGVEEDLVNENWLVHNVLDVEEGKDTRKYSMAQCGLQSERNAFVCIAGTDIFLKSFIDESTKILKEKKMESIYIMTLAIIW